MKLITDKGRVKRKVDPDKVAEALGAEEIRIKKFNRALATVNSKYKTTLEKLAKEEK